MAIVQKLQGTRRNEGAIAPFGSRVSTRYVHGLSAHEAAVAARRRARAVAAPVRPCERAPRSCAPHRYCRRPGTAAALKLHATVLLHVRRMLLGTPERGRRAAASGRR